MDEEQIDLPEELILNLKHYLPGQLNDLIEQTWHLPNLEELILTAFGRAHFSSKFLGIYKGNEIACFDFALALVRLHLKYARSRTDFLPTFNMRFIKCVLDSKTLVLLSFFSEAIVNGNHNIFLDSSCLFASLQENPTVELTECMRMVMPRQIEAKFKQAMNREWFGLVVYFKKMKNARFQYVQHYIENEDPPVLFPLNPPVLLSTISRETKHYHHFLKMRKNRSKIRSSILLESAIQTTQFECFENVSSISLSRKAWGKVFDALLTRPSQAEPVEIAARRAVCPELINRELTLVPSKKLKSLYLTTSSTWDEAQLRTSIDLAFQAIISSAYLERVQCLFLDINTDYLPLVRNFLDNTAKFISIIRPVDWEIHFPIAEDFDELQYIGEMQDRNLELKQTFHYLRGQLEMDAVFRMVCARMIRQYNGQSKVRILPLDILRRLHTYLV